MTSDLGPSTSDIGLFLHASAVAVAGEAVLFLGHSTAGKSTIAHRLSERIPILADDSVYAAKGADRVWRVVDGGFRFDQGWGVPEWRRAVRERIEHGEGLPLRALFRIFKGKSARAERLDALELARYLMDAALEIDVQRKPRKVGVKPKISETDILRERILRRTWFGWVAEIARSHPGWNLAFTKDTPAAELIRWIGQ